MKVKSKVIWGIITLILAVLSVRLVASQSSSLSAGELFEILGHAPAVWNICILLCVISFLGLEAWSIYKLLKSAGYTSTPGQCLLYTSSDIFFSAITPSATGGQPACLYFMMKNGISGSRATVTLLVYLVLHIAATILIGAVGLISKPQAFADFELISRILIIWGTIVITGLVVFFLMLLKHQNILIKGTERFTAFLERHHVLNEKRRTAIVSKIRDYAINCSECEKMMSDDKKTIAQCFVINLLQRAAQVLIMSFVYLGMGGTVGKAYEVFVTEMFVIIGSCSLPVPGGIGAYDYLMIDGFDELIGGEAGVRLEIIGRSISFYLEVLISAVIIIAGIIQIRRRSASKAAAE